MIRTSVLELIRRSLRRDSSRSTIPTSAGPTKIHHVDDPESPIRLIRASGPLDARSFEHLLACWEHVTTPHALHLDLTDARIMDERTMRRLELALDQLERQRIDVRVVGIDPSHPSIAV